MRAAALALSIVATFAAGAVIGRGAAPAASAQAPAWSVAGELSRTRAYARAIALDTGEILVVGGLDAQDPQVTIRTTEVFDPVTGHVSVLPQKLLGRLNQTLTTAWGQRIVVAGGTEWVGDHWNSVAKVDVYLPWSRTWLRAAPMLQPRSDHGAAALPDGRVFVTGGNYNNRLLAVSEIYDPRIDVWTPVRPLPQARTQFSIATLPDGTVLVAGGFENDGKLATSTRIYDPTTDLWTDGPAMEDARLNHTMVQLPGGDLLFFGGESLGAGTAERYSWRDRSFSRAGVLGEPRLVAQGAMLPDGSVLAVGGLPQEPARHHFDPTASAELWDPMKQIWRDISDAPTKRAYAQLITTDHGVFRLSGVGDDESPFATIEALDLH